MATSTSRFIQLNDFVLLEYKYTNYTLPDLLGDDVMTISNSFTGEKQIINPDGSASTTGNVQEFSCIKTSSTVYTYLDKDQIPTYLQYSGNTVTTLNPVITNSVPYDEVWFHLISGYNFEDAEGVIFRIAAVERNGKECVLACISFDKMSDNFEYNSDEILLGGKLYNRRVQVKIPSIKQIQDEYVALEGNLNQPNCFAAQISSDGKGFRRGQPLRISAIMIAKSDVLVVSGAHYKRFYAGTTSAVTINQFDEFELLGAHIAESTNGDFYEYFATWDGGFIEDWILSANSLPGNEFVILHELSVVEQVGSSFIPTFNLQSIQEKDFAEAQMFRPVILNAAFAIAYTIQYTMRLYNKADQSQIIRVATVLSFEPKKYGKNLNRITILDEPHHYKIYNKVVSGPTIEQAAFINTYSEVVPFNTRYVPSFFERTALSISKDTVFIDGNGELKGDKQPPVTVVWGQGQATIQLTPFDNYFKFKIIKTDSGQPVPVDLGTSADFYISFIDDSGTKVRFNSIADPIYGDHSKGDLLFKIPGDQATKILLQSQQEFWITSKFTDGSETVLYQGKFIAADKAADLITTEQAATSQAATDLAAVSLASQAATDAANINNTGGLFDVAGLMQVAKDLNTKDLSKSLAAVEIPGAAQSVVTLKTGITAGIKPVAYQNIATKTILSSQPIKQTDTGTTTGE